LPVITRKLSVDSRGNCDIISITESVNSILAELEISDGIVTVFVPGATGVVTTIEYEPGLLQDLPQLLDKLIPQGSYNHDRTWHDGNGHSHLRATLIGPSLTIPFSERTMLLGTWQSVVFVDMDVRPRRRELILQIIGE